MTAQKTKPTQKRLNNCVLSPLRWAKIYEKLENCACGTLKIKDAVANAAVRVANAPKKGRARRNTMLLGKYPINRLRAQNAGFFDAMTNILRQSLIRVEVAFMQTPWPVTAFLFLALAWAYTSRATTLFVASSLAFLAVFELWQIAMQTMALVVVATAICVFVGLPVGIRMAKNRYFQWITEPVLDVMQTIPSLSYLLPAVAFFGIS